MKIIIDNRSDKMKSITHFSKVKLQYITELTSKFKPTALKDRLNWSGINEKVYNRYPLGRI
jgi:hypothetical protein